MIYQYNSENKDKLKYDYAKCEGAVLGKVLPKILPERIGKDILIVYPQKEVKKYFKYINGIFSIDNNKDDCNINWLNVRICKIFDEKDHYFSYIDNYNADTLLNKKEKSLVFLISIKEDSDKLAQPYHENNQLLSTISMFDSIIEECSKVHNEYKYDEKYQENAEKAGGNLQIYVLVAGALQVYNIVYKLIDECKEITQDIWYKIFEELSEKEKNIWKLINSIFNIWRTNMV